MFKELTGRDWHEDRFMKIDSEKKITEFDYEDFLPQSFLKRVDTKSPEFK
jgi:hypothetical protein